jgi:protein SCO1
MAINLRKLVRNPWLWAFIIGAVTLTLLRPLMRRIPDPPPVIAQLPAFELVNQDDQPWGTAQMQGKVWIVSFFFTTCQSVCPYIAEKMRMLQDRLIEDDIPVQLLSISVDPFSDTPQRLRDFAAAHGAHLDRWTFLTGPEDDVRALVVGGFMTGMGIPQRDDTDMVDIAHSVKFVLVDQQGRIRGYYDTDEQGLDEIFNRAQHVLYAGMD